MNIDVLLATLSGLVSMAFGTLIFASLRRRPYNVRTRTPAQTYTQRLARLTDSLRRSSADVDALIEELSSAAQQREAAALKLEADLATLSAREQDLKKRVSHLQDLPLQVAEHFAALTKASERKNARRDYMLFGLGVLVSTLLSIIFFVIQG